MIIVTQAVLIIVALFVAIISLSHRSTHSGRAWKKIGLVLLSIGMIIAVLFPSILDKLALLAGIGRGADLLLYVAIVAFIFYVLNSYLHQQDQRDVLFRLARKIALVDANERYNIKKK